MFLKICGLTNEDDAAHAAAAGATALGVVFAPASARCVTLDQARDIVRAAADVPVVGVFVNEPVESIVATVAHTGIRMVQLHGDEPERYTTMLEMPVLRAVGVDAAADPGWLGATLLLDAVAGTQRGGTGVRVDWTKAAAIASGRKAILAGGLTPDNVAEAIATVQPFGVDVSSGVERAPGVKDRDKVARFLENAREAFARLERGVRAEQAE